MKEEGPRIITSKDLSVHTIQYAYNHGYKDAKVSLLLGQQYALRVADEQKEQLAFMHVPYDIFDVHAGFGKVYAIDGIGFRLGPQLRRHVEKVSLPQDLPVNQDWVAISGGHRAVITSNTLEAVEYLEAFLASRNTPKGREQLVKFLYKEAVSLAIEDGQKVFTSENGRFLHLDNMFSALARSIEPLVHPSTERERRHGFQQALSTRRGNLMLVH